MYEEFAAARPICVSAAAVMARQASRVADPLRRRLLTATGDRHTRSQLAQAGSSGWCRMLIKIPLLVCLANERTSVTYGHGCSKAGSQAPIAGSKIDRNGIFDYKYNGSPGFYISLVDYS